MTGFERFCAWFMARFFSAKPEAIADVAPIAPLPIPPPVIVPPDVPTPKPAPMPTPTQPTVVVHPVAPAFPPLLTALCNAIKIYEGWILPGGKDSVGNVYPTGSFSYKFNNPGNLVFEGQPFATGVTVQTPAGPHTFASFDTYDHGFSALCRQIQVVANGTDVLYRHEAMSKFGLSSCAMLTLVQFFAIYSPSSDGNNPNAYANWIGAQIGVNASTFTMQQLIA